MKIEPKGPRAAQLRQRKFHLLSSLRIPPDALPGSLALTHRRCGKSSCHCASGKGHPQWSLTFMDKGKKRVERIPNDLVDTIRKKVEEGRGFKEAVAEIMTANADLLVLWRKEKDL